MSTKLITISLILGFSQWNWLIADSYPLLASNKEEPGLTPYSLPVTERVAQPIIKASKDLNISIFDFYKLRGMNFHTSQTTQLNPISGNGWRLEFAAVPDVAIVTLVSQNTLETKKGSDGKLLAIPELVVLLKEGIRAADPTGNNLKRLRQFDE